MQTETHLYQGDVFKVLARLPEHSVHCVVTSVPYWGMREYDIEPSDKHLELGREATIEQYVRNMVKLGRAIRRVLRKDGTYWLNIGDSYNSPQTRGSFGDQSMHGYTEHGTKRVVVPGLSKKCRLAQPQRVLLAMIADKWVWRDEVVWSKPNAQPSSVEDRTTPSHEMFYMFSASDRYYYDRFAIQELSISDHSSGGDFIRPERLLTIDPNGTARGNEDEWERTETRNKRSVWSINTFAYPKAHFATFPPELIKYPILACTSEKGCCADCGKCWKRVTEKKKVQIDTGNRKRADCPGQELSASSTLRTGEIWRYETLYWEPDCDCHEFEPGFYERFGTIHEKEPEPIPCTVLDPFMGSGTTAMVAARLGRNSIGIDLSVKYVEQHQRERMAEEMTLFNLVKVKTLKEMSHAHANTVKPRSKRSLPVGDLPPHGEAADIKRNPKARRKTPAGAR